MAEPKVTQVTDGDEHLRHGPLRRWIGRRPRLLRLYRVCIGVVGGWITALGVLLMPLPGPGILVVLAGLWVLGREFTWARRLTRVVERLWVALKAWNAHRRERVRAAEAADGTRRGA